MRIRGRVAALLALAVLAGCADDAVDEAEPERAPGALDWNDGTDPDLVGVPIAVGGQEGDLDEVLRAIAIEVTEAAGLQVTAMDASGSSRDVREDQLAGLIDLTWETTGTG